MSFHDLHHQGVPFVLPNAWDVPSALAYLAEGFTAIGTTSFGVSSSGGHPDGHRATRGANIALAAALAPLQCYVSVDIEDGYSDEPDAIADYARRGARLLAPSRHLGLRRLRLRQRRAGDEWRWCPA